MSKEVKTEMKDHSLVEYWGGNEKGVCLQITENNINIKRDVTEQLQEAGFIKLTMEEASALCENLVAFISKEAKRRQSLLNEQLKELKLREKNVFQEVSDLNVDSFNVMKFSVDLVSKFCPKSK